MEKYVCVSGKCFENSQQGRAGALGWRGVRAAKRPGGSGYNCEEGSQGNPCFLGYFLSGRPSANLQNVVLLRGGGVCELPAANNF